MPQAVVGMCMRCVSNVLYLGSRLVGLNRSTGHGGFLSANPDLCARADHSMQTGMKRSDNDGRYACYQRRVPMSGSRFAQVAGGSCCF